MSYEPVVYTVEYPNGDPADTGPDLTLDQAREIAMNIGGYVIENTYSWRDSQIVGDYSNLLDDDGLEEER